MVEPAQLLSIHVGFDVAMCRPALALDDQTAGIDVRACQQPLQLPAEGIISQHADRVDLLDPEREKIHHNISRSPRRIALRPHWLGSLAGLQRDLRRRAIDRPINIQAKIPQHRHRGAGQVVEGRGNFLPAENVEGLKGEGFHGWCSDEFPTGIPNPGRLSKKKCNALQLGSIHRSGSESLATNAASKSLDCFRFPKARSTAHPTISSSGWR